MNYKNFTNYFCLIYHKKQKARAFAQALCNITMGINPM